MTKVIAILFSVGCLQLLSLGSAAIKYELLWMRYPGEGIQNSTSDSMALHVASTKSVVACDSVTDTDGHVYHVVKIGKQRWLKENLKTAHFRDGSVIPEMEYDIDWTNPRGSGWCYYERNNANNYQYGKLYNWYAVTDPHQLCPTGYHVPSDSEFQVLSDYLGGDDISGKHMKAIQLWGKQDDSYADDAAGFTAVPAGIRYRNGSFDRAGADGADFWTSTVYRRGSVLCRILYYGGTNLGRHTSDVRAGFSVRCVGD